MSIYKPIRVQIAYDESNEKMFITIGNNVIEIKGIDFNIFESLCQSFAEFNEKIKDLRRQSEWPLYSSQMS